MSLEAPRLQAVFQNDLTEPTIRGADASIWLLRRLIIPCVSNSHAGHILKSDVRAYSARRQVCLCGRSDFVFGLVDLLVDSFGSRNCYGFKAPLVAFVFSTSCLTWAISPTSACQVVNAITAACSVLFAGASDCGSIPAFSGSQSVSFFSMAHDTTAILRARAMAAFFLRVFWPPWMRS